MSKDKICDLLSKSKAKKSKELLQYLQDPNTPKEKLDIVSLDKNTNELINFVDHKQNIIHFNNKALKYFIYNEQFYFKAKDVANILDYVNTKVAIFDHVDEMDKFTQEYFAPGFKGSDSLPLSSFQLVESKKLEKYLENEHKQTIFINESGLYSLIMSSKKEEAKSFKRWVTSEVLPSIRKNGSYVSKKMLEYNKDDLKTYYNKDCVYILHIKDNIYKYGKTSDIQDRFYRHKQHLGYINIEKIYVLNSINQINILEDDIKEFTKINKINYCYNNGKKPHQGLFAPPFEAKPQKYGVEFFECNNNFPLNKVIENIDNLYKKVKNNANSTDLLLEKILEKLSDIDMRLTILEKQPKNSINQGKSDIYENKTLQSTELKQPNDTESKKESPSLEKLKKDFEELKFCSRVAYKYNVSPNTIRNWINKLENSKQTDTKLEKVLEEKSKETKNLDKKLCPDCKIPIFYRSKRCNDCSNKNKIKIKSVELNRPSLEQLKNDLKELKSMVQVGIKYKVSDNAVRKWIKNYEKIATV
jgi:prophage antirepressor-like protein/transposase-like protein/predicted GIY-YIG superfamily endonuclease